MKQRRKERKQKTDMHRKSKIIDLGISAVLTALVLFVYYNRCGSVFETNDDRVIAELLGGVVTGQPTGQVLSLRILLGGSIAFLYRLAGGIPWYGIFLIGAAAVSYCLLAYVFLQTGQRTTEKIPGLLGAVFVLLCGLHPFGRVGYQMTAGLLAACGYGAVLGLPKKRGSWVLLGILEFLAYQLNPEAFWIVLPAGALLILVSVWGAEEKQRRLLGDGGIAFGIVLGIVLISMLGEILFGGYFSHNAWEIREYEKIRTRAVTTYGIPEPENMQEVLERYGVSAAQTDALAKIWFYENELPKECLAALGDISKAEYQKQHPASFGKLISGTFEKLYRADQKGYQKYAVFLFAASLVILGIGRRKRGLVELGCLYCSTFLTGMCLEGAGVLTAKSGMLLLAVQVILGMTILLKEGFVRQDKKWKLCLASAVLCLLLSASALQTVRVYWTLRAENPGIQENFAGLDAVYAYCQDHSGQCFVLPKETWMHYTGSVFAKSKGKESAGLKAGGWVFGIPAVRDYEARYRARTEGLYIIAPGGENTELSRYWQKLWEEKSGKEPQKIDSFTAGNGLLYDVYRIE